MKKEGKNSRIFSSNQLLPLGCCRTRRTGRRIQDGRTGTPSHSYSPTPRTCHPYRHPVPARGGKQLLAVAGRRRTALPDRRPDPPLMAAPLSPSVPFSFYSSLYKRHLWGQAMGAFLVTHPHHSSNPPHVICSRAHSIVGEPCNYAGHGLYLARVLDVGVTRLSPRATSACLWCWVAI